MPRVGGSRLIIPGVLRVMPMWIFCPVPFCRWRRAPATMVPFDVHDPAALAAACATAMRDEDAVLVAHIEQRHDVHELLATINDLGDQLAETSARLAVAERVNTLTRSDTD